MARDTTDSRPVEGIDQLVAWLAKGNKPRDRWRIGTEHEKFPFYVDGHAPVPYGGERGIRAILEGMQEKLGWDAIIDDGRIIGLVEPTGQGAISLEPGGQFELSGAPVETTRPAARATRIWRRWAKSPSRSAFASSASAAARNGRWPRRR